jgi:pimeloyl-ACP methyl ester carboxylesterase
LGSYVDAGVKTWFDTAGDAGEPLVLLHGGLVGNESWGMQMPAFAESFRVFAPERRAHGHTPDVDGPLTYEDMASDTIAFLEEVVGEPAHLVGWSDGGNVALLVAIERPDLVRKIVVIGSNYDTAGMVADAALELSPDEPALAMFKMMYEAASPDGAEHWPVFVGKIDEMWKNFHVPIERLVTIEAPTLVMVGDDDAVTLEHTIEMYRAIPNADLAVIPHASHVVPMEQADVVNQTILRFVQNDPPVTLMPIRRAEPG